MKNNMKFMNAIKNIRLILAIMIFSLVVNSCEDANPTEYIPQTFVEGYLIVGRPIDGIMVSTTLPTSSVYSRENATIKDAEVTITVDDQVYSLNYKAGEHPGYALDDQSVKVMPEKLYKLKIVLKDGSLLTGETNTPSLFAWDNEPKPSFYFPKDTLKLDKVDSLGISWTRSGNNPFYLLCINCLDTLEYGKYLDNPTNELNRRTYTILSKMEDESQYKNTTTWAFISNLETPTVWMAFKWFGKQRVSVYSPDNNMLSWFINIGFINSSLTDENHNSIIGGIGVFGSAAIIEKETYLYKNQP